MPLTSDQVAENDEQKVREHIALVRFVDNHMRHARKPSVLVLPAFLQHPEKDASGAEENAC